MIIDDQVKKIIQDFSRKDTRTEQSKQSNTVSQSDKSKRRTVFKLKNTLLHNSVSPDIRKLYYQTQNSKEQSMKELREINSSKKSEFNQSKKSETLTDQSKTISLPSVYNQYTQEQIKDLQILIQEIYPADHQIWQELQQDENQTIEDLISQNVEYFQGLLNLYYYEQQVANMLNEKAQMNKKYVTQYSSDYPGKLVTESPKISQRIYDNFKPQETQFLNKSSMYNSHYVQQQYLKTNNYKPEHIPNQAGMSFLSSYQSQYRDWNPRYQGKITSNNQYLNSSLPFIAKTNYKDDFKGLNGEKAKLAEFSKIGPFHSEPKLLIKETTSQSYFCPREQKDDQIQSYNPISPKVQLTKSYEGQYNSNFRKSFTSKNSDSPKDSKFADKFFQSNIIKNLMQKKYKTRI